MSISDITAAQVADYLRIDDPSEVELAEIQMFMDSAKASIISMTGLTQEEIDDLTEEITKTKEKLEEIHRTIKSFPGVSGTRTNVVLKSLKVGDTLLPEASEASLR